MKNGKEVLEHLNTTYNKIHTTYEDLFWTSFMGDHSVNIAKDVAQQAREDFRTNEAYKILVDEWYEKSTGLIKERLGYWQKFFSLYQIPEKARGIKQKISDLETKIEKIRATRKQGYIDPVKNKFIKASVNAMRGTQITNENESVRKACFEAMTKLAIANAEYYVELVNLRNEFARTLGYEDFYAYKLMSDEGMTKKELFDLFDTIYDKTKYAFKNMRDLEKTKMGLRQPWNYSYLMAGSFIKEEDAYFPFEKNLERWGTSFAALGITYQGSRLVFDLLDREGKYNNGFCHWPEIVQFKDGKRIAGRSQLTCNVVLGMPGQSQQGLDTLFHEGGHAAHMLNIEMKDAATNTEFPPMSTGWAETQSMFLDTIASSIEWKTRYAKTIDGQPYPFELFERRVRAFHSVTPLSMMGLARVCAFEKIVYETKNLTPEKVIAAARKISKKYLDFKTDSLSVLETPHIYAWDNACGYQGYALAELALSQWREHFFKKYGYIVDNPKIGKDMKKVWSYGSAKTLPVFLKLATGKKLSADPYIKAITRSIPAILKLSKERIETLSKKPLYKKSINLDAHITLVHGKEIIADNKKSFEAMSDKYSAWLLTQKH
jgi:Zn-dependent oligopeptidase